jgi:hypothetical protein
MTRYLFSREAINIAILEMSEDGTLSSLKRKWWYEQSECHSDTTKVCLIEETTIVLLLI